MEWKWEYFGATIIFVIIGYLIGSISFSILLSKRFFKEDVREKGSGNAGATNVLRNYGKKIAFFVFILDVLKPILAALIVYIVKINTDNFLSGAWVQPAAFAALLGHIFPIFFKFKGGKGAACMLGLFITVNWMLAIIGFIIFVLIVTKSKMVSLGSILAPFLLLIIQIIFIFTPHMNDAWSNPISRKPQLWINSIFIAVAWVIITIKHKNNIKRMLKGEERKLNSSTKK